jgi:heme o synthase
LEAGFENQFQQGPSPQYALSPMPRIRTAPLERTPLLDNTAAVSGIAPDRSPLGRIKAYVALTKPRIIEQLLITTIPTMFVARHGMPGVWLMVATLVGGTLAAGGANAINMVVDRDIDTIMERTKGRPLVTGAMTPRAALIFAVTIEIAAFVWLWGFVNLLSAVLAVSACLFYVFIYTLWLKRTSKQNIVIGGAAGAVPVLVGWSAVLNRLDWAPVLLFAVIFVWTPPHFWALAVKYRDDYAAADVPMLPVVASFRNMANQIIVYSVIMVGLTIWFGPVAGMGRFYMASAVLLGAMFLFYAAKLYQSGMNSVEPGAMAGAATVKPAMRLFAYSIAYLTLLFLAMAIDQLLVHGF